MAVSCCFLPWPDACSANHGEGRFAGGAMEQINLAAAIVKFAGWEIAGTAGNQDDERLTNEQAINLVDWLQSGPSLNIWRQIELMRSARLQSQAVSAQASAATSSHPK